ncbi:DUF4343 domain-containing protein [bacterium]|nr:MAG: DUF4343 domain-containing protein [bacterium]
MPTLILPPRFSEDSNTLWRTAIELGWDIERLQSWRVPEGFRPDGDVAIYGESLWANFVAEQLGVKLYEPPLDWLASLDYEFVGRCIEFCTFEEARTKQFPLFVKPASEKTFEARVYAGAHELPADIDQPELAPVLTSQPVEWEVEYRCFVLEERVVTASSYWRGEDSTRKEDGSYDSPPEELKAACDFAGRVIGKSGGGFGERGAVIDVGILRGFGWAVVEANPAWGAGFYGCDPRKALGVIASCVSKSP